MIKVDFVKFADIKKFASKAAKEGVSLKDTPSTLWFGAWEGDQIVGFAGLLIKIPKARMKSVWIIPEHRGKGYGHLLTQHRLDACKKNKNIRKIEAYSLHPQYFQNTLGWKVKGQYKPNTWIVETYL